MKHYWLEFKNGAAWEFSDKPAPHRECVEVVEFSEYKKISEYSDSREEIIKLLREERDEWKNAFKREVAGREHADEEIKKLRTEIEEHKRNPFNR